MPARANRIVAMRKKRRSFESSSRSLGLPAILKKKRRKPAAPNRRSQTGMPASSVGIERMTVCLFAELIVDQETADAEGEKKQKEDDVGGVGAYLRDDVELSGGEREHENHDDEIEGFVHE